MAPNPKRFRHAAAAPTGPPAESWRIPRWAAQTEAQRLETSPSHGSGEPPRRPAR